MSTYSAFVPTDPDAVFGGLRIAPALATALDGTPVTTYYYRTTGGTRGSTTSLASVPAGAVVERIATT